MGLKNFFSTGILIFFSFNSSSIILSNFGCLIAVEIMQSGLSVAISSIEIILVLPIFCPFKSGFLSTTPRMFVQFNLFVLIKSFKNKLAPQRITFLFLEKLFNFLMSDLYFCFLLISSFLSLYFLLSSCIHSNFCQGVNFKYLQ